MKFVALAWVRRLVTDRRTLFAVIVAAVGLVAAARLASEGGNPLDWYMAYGRGERRDGA